jgi:cytochrome P450
VTATLDLFDGAFWQDPYPAYAALRAAEPVRAVRRRDGEVWLLTRYADVRAALADPRLSKDWRYRLPPEQRAAAGETPIPMMILLDPPAHTRLRKLVSRSFTLRRMEELRPRVEEIAGSLLSALPPVGRVDLMAEYAFLLPVFVICELLGVPVADRDRFAAWSRTMVDDERADDERADDERADDERADDERADDERADDERGAPDAGQAASFALHGYLAELIARKRAEPDDALLSALVEVAEDGDRLSADELVAMAMLLLIAGHETTVNLIGNGVLALLAHPDQRELLRQRPELLPVAVEEFLRWDSPVHSTPVRFAAEDVEYSGVTIPARSVVTLSLAAANRDPERFPDAEELRVDRDASGHVAFGHGLHHCLGAQLARIEGQVAIGMLLRQRPRLALAVDPRELVQRRSMLVRGLTELPVELGLPA